VNGLPVRGSARKKRPRGLYDRARGLHCGLVEFYCVMVTFTVIAVLVTPPEDGVITMVDDLDPPADPLQPATSTNTIIAPAIPRRVRNRRASGSMNSRAIAIMMKSTCRRNADGGTFMDCGGTMKDAAVMEPFTVVPGAGAALAVGTEHEVINAPVPGAQVEATAPVNPPKPVTTTGNMPVAPRATLMAAADTEKSHAGPLSGTVLTLPPVCVIVSEPATGPGGVAATGLKVTTTTQAAPFAAMTIGKVPLLQATVLDGAAVNTPGAAAIDAILSGALPLLPMETVAVVDVVSRAPGKVRLLGVSVMLPEVPLPVPVSATCIGWDKPSNASTMFSTPATAPAAVGVNTTPMLHEAPPASDAVQGVVPLALPTKSGLVLVGGSVKPIAFAVLFVIVTN
jgi:hypothetical protein